jgi:beta-lactamase superfamily II metal-dependent hydrolase
MIIVFIIFLLFSCGNDFDRDFSYENNNKNETLKIIALNIGQGSATLIISPNNQSILIDAGPEESGHTKILPFLKENKITKPAYFLATHYDADHIGGFDEVVKGEDEILGTTDDIIPNISYDRGDEHVDKGGVYLEYVNALSNVRKEIEAGEIINLGNDTIIKCVIVNGRLEHRVININEQEENEHSIGVLITFFNFKFFIGGDLTGDLEIPVSEEIKKIDGFLVDHHGSSSSTNENFLINASPLFAIIQVGENSYGHPSADVITRLLNHNVDVYSTTNGAYLTIPNIKVENDDIYIYVNKNGNYTIF